MSGLIGLLEITTDVAENVSNVVVRHPSKVFHAKVLNWGLLSRSIPQPPGVPRIGEFTVEISNADLNYSALRAREILRGKMATLKVGAPGGSYTTDFSQLYSGVIAYADLVKGGSALRLTIRDEFFDTFREYPSGLITGAVFSNLPDLRPWVFRNILYGRVTNVPCPLVDTTTHKHCVAQHVCKSLVNAYVYNQHIVNDLGMVLNTDYFWETSAVGGVTHQFIRFATSQIDANRPDEIAVTVDVDGKTDDGTAGGNLLDNPMLVAEDYLVNVMGISSGKLDSTSKTSTAASYTSLGWVASVLIGHGNTLQRIDHQGVLTRLADSFNLDIFLNKSGMLAFNHFAVTEDSLNPLVNITDRSSILSGSFEQLDNRNTINQMVYRNNYNWAAGYFQNQGTHDDTTGQTEIGKTISEDSTLWYVGSDSVALEVVQDKIRFLKRDNDPIVIEASLPELFNQVELADIVGVSHYAAQSLDKKGVFNAPVKVSGITIDLNRMTIKIEGFLTNVTRRHGFFLGDRTAQAADWAMASETDREFGYLANRTDSEFSTGDEGKVLYSR